MQPVVPKVIQSAKSESDFFRIFFGHSTFQFWAAGVDFGVFDTLAGNPGKSADELGNEVGLDEFSTDILISGLKSLDLVIADGPGLKNGPMIESVLSTDRWDLIKKWARFEYRIVYKAQTDFITALRLGTLNNSSSLSKNEGDFYQRIAKDPELSECFYDYMGAWSQEAGNLLLKEVEFTSKHKILDIGGGEGSLAKMLVEAGSKVAIIDLPEVCDLAERRVNDSRIRYLKADFFQDPWPQTFNRILMAHQLVIWSPNKNKYLLQKAWNALSAGGDLVIISSMRNEDGETPFTSVMDLPYFVAGPSVGGQIYRASEYLGWLRDVGFSNLRRIVPEERWTPHEIIIASKE